MQKSFYITAALLVGAGLTAGAPVAHASCAASTCFLVTGTQEGIANPGQVIMDLSYRYITMDRPQHGSNEASEALTASVDFASGEIEPDHHRELRTVNELAQLDISYGLTPKFALSVSIPFMNNRYHEHDIIHGPGDEDYASERISGMGDLRLTGKYAVHTSIRHLLVAGLGVKAPTGEYKLRNSSGDINEPSVMPGSGAWDGLLSLHYAYQIQPVLGTAWSLNSSRGAWRRLICRLAVKPFSCAVKWGKQILAATEQGLAIPENERPQWHERRKLKPGDKVLADLMMALVRQRGLEHGVAPSLLATASDLEAIIADDPEAALRSGWRARPVGNELGALLAGHLSIHVEEGRIVVKPTVGD